MKKNNKKLALLAIMFAMCVSLFLPMDAQAAAKKTKLNKTKVQLLKGTKYQLKLKDKNGKTIPASSIKFSSKNKKVATVNTKGKITAKKKGTTYIYAKYKGKKYKCKVVVFTAEIKTNIKFGTYLEATSRRSTFVRPVYFKIKTSRAVPVKYKTLTPKKAKITSKGKVVFRSYDSIESLDYWDKYTPGNINEAKIEITLGDSKVTRIVPYGGYLPVLISEGDEDDKYWKMCWNDEKEAANTLKDYDKWASLVTFFKTAPEEYIAYSKSQATPIKHEGMTYYKFFRKLNTLDPEFNWEDYRAGTLCLYKPVQNEKNQYAYVAFVPEPVGYPLLIWR